MGVGTPMTFSEGCLLHEVLLHVSVKAKHSEGQNDTLQTCHEIFVLVFLVDINDLQLILAAFHRLLLLFLGLGGIHPPRRQEAVHLIAHQQHPPNLIPFSWRTKGTHRELIQRTQAYKIIFT